MSKETLESAKDQYIETYYSEVRKQGLVPNDSFQLMADALNDFVKQIKKNGYEIVKVVKK